MPGYMTIGRGTFRPSRATSSYGSNLAVPCAATLHPCLRVGLDMIDLEGDGLSVEMMGGKAGSEPDQDLVIAKGEIDRDDVGRPLPVDAQTPDLSRRAGQFEKSAAFFFDW